MKSGFLSSYFVGIAIKRLSAVEVEPNISHQHEFNGVAPLKELLGKDRQQNIKARFIYLDDDDTNIVTEDINVTWYDARANHPSRSEYRLYYRSSLICEKANADDLLIIGKRQDQSLLIIIVRSRTTIENQILWLFSSSEDTLSDVGNRFSVYPAEAIDKAITYPVQLILQELGIDTVSPLETDIERVRRMFNEFPSTREFSAFARSTIPDVSAIDDPDQAIVAWMQQEERLFRALEHYLVETRIQEGFTDVDNFIRFCLSVQNRRKSRAGLALENHMEQIFIENNIMYSRNAITENRVRPDFLFPSIKHYNNQQFPAELLTMLGIKSTCKDRWRQVLSEAKRIQTKHLLTLEPRITQNQTDEMQANKLQLVVPAEIQETYSPAQRKWLYKVSDFLKLVKERQQQAQELSIK